MSAPKMKNKVILLLLLVFVGFLSGCGESYVKTEYIKGKVIFKGEPLADAMVTFHPKDSNGVPASGTSNSNGEFELFAVGGKPGAGAIAGNYTVTVTKLNSENKEIPDPNSSGGVRVVVSSTLVTPKAFSKKETSSLTVTVASGKNDPITIDLDKK